MEAQIYSDTSSFPVLTVVTVVVVVVVVVLAVVVVCGAASAQHRIDACCSESAAVLMQVGGFISNEVAFPAATQRPVLTFSEVQPSLVQTNSLSIIHPLAPATSCISSASKQSRAPAPLQIELAVSKSSSSLL